MADPPNEAVCRQRPAFSSAYPYLLGIYLGDGVISAGRRGVWHLRITMDGRYPGVNARVASALATVGGHRVGVVHRGAWIELGSYWKHWVCLFPQHGAGPKHLRRIALADWQHALVARTPTNSSRG